MGIPTRWKGGDDKLFHYQAQENEDEDGDPSASSFDLAHFGLSESDGEGLLDLSQQSDDRDASRNASQSDDRDAQIKAAQAGIQASFLARERFLAGTLEENDDAIEEVRERRSTHVNLNAQALASALSKEMTENSNLFQSQKKRVEEAASVSKPAQLTFDGDVSFGPQDIIEEDQKEQPKPKPKPAPKPLKPKQRSVCSADKFTYRNMCLVSLVLVLLIGAILVPVGVTQDWFADSSSSKKLNQEEPTYSPTTEPTTRNPGLRPTTSPTNLVPTSGPTLEPTTEPFLSPSQSPTTRPSTPVPTASPSAFVAPADFVSLIAATSFDDGASVKAEGTPQSEAATWVASRTLFDTLTDQQKIQRYALATFYYSTNGDSWTNNDGWLSDDNECTWYTRSLFIDVCDSNGVITGLELGFNNLGGVIPPEIGLLTSLTRISLGAGLRGDIQGTLPSQLGRLSLMENFNVRDNEISGIIPPELGAWSSLDVLDLSRNKFSGPIPTTIGQMTALTRLDLGRNELTGDVPSELAALNVVESVRLEQNDLTGAIPRDVCTFFSRTVPLFYTDCGVPAPGADSEVACSCCSHCCSDEQGCFSV
jgi:hypothetical protein